MKLEELLQDEEIREALRKIIEYEEREEERMKNDPVFKGIDIKPFWSWKDVKVPWNIIRKLLLADLVDALGRRHYILKDREKTKALLEMYEQKIKVPETPVEEVKFEEIKIPDDIFDIIIGHDKIKKLFLMSIKSEKPTHILLIGPPACAKTLFLLEVSRLPGAFYVLGGSTTKVGLIDQLFQLQPRFVLIDELDKMEKDDLVALLSLMETGIVKEVKHGKTREIRLPAKVYAACNETKGLPPELLSRFHFKINLKPYTREEFIKVSTMTLVKREGTDKELAEYISKKLSQFSLDVRDSIGVARMAKTKEDVDFLIDLKKEYL